MIPHPPVAEIARGYWRSSAENAGAVASLDGAEGGTDAQHVDSGSPPASSSSSGGGGGAAVEDADTDTSGPPIDADGC